MKKKIEIEVNACDNCHRHDMSLQTCIGCGITLCSFCGRELLEGTIEECNRYHCHYSGYRRFVGFKYDFDMTEMFFCLECLKDPNKHKVMGLLSACIKKEKMVKEHQTSQAKWENQRETIVDKIHRLTYATENRLREKDINLIKPDKNQ